MPKKPKYVLCHNELYNLIFNQNNILGYLDFDKISNITFYAPTFIFKLIDEMIIDNEECLEKSGQIKRMEDMKKIIKIVSLEKEDNNSNSLKLTDAYVDVYQKVDADGIWHDLYSTMRRNSEIPYVNSRQIAEFLFEREDASFEIEKRRKNVE